MAKPLNLAKATDEELAAESKRLAKLRTEVRLAQNAVQTEIETRTMLAGLSGATREAVLVRLGGSIGSEGTADAKEVRS